MAPKARIGSMREQVRHGVSAPWGFVFALVIFASTNTGIAKTPRTLAPPIRPAPAGIKQIGRQDDSSNVKPASDLVLLPENERKAGALAHFVQGMAFEENGEMDQALDAYRKVLNVDPGQSDLAARVAALLLEKKKRRSRSWIAPQRFGATTRASGPGSANFMQPFFSNLTHCRNRTI